MHERPKQNMFVNKNAIKSDFGNISHKVGISHIGWELLWEFGNWAWEFLCFGSSNTGYHSQRVADAIRYRAGDG